MPLVGVPVLEVDAVGAGALAACSTSAAAVLALPLGELARPGPPPIVITADVAQAVVLTTVPLAAAFDALTSGHLAAVAVVLNACSVLSSICASAHLPALVGRDRLVAANSRLEATSWCAAVAGPALAGCSARRGRCWWTPCRSWSAPWRCC